MRTKRNIAISKSAIIGYNVQIGRNAIIHDHAEIMDHTIIGDNCIIGEPDVRYYKDDNYTNPKTQIGPHSLIRSGSIIYSGSLFGEYFATGNMVSIREKSIFGEHCSVGTFSDVQGDVKFGDYCRLNSHVQIGSKCMFGSFVFIYPMVVFTNDPLPPSNHLVGTTVDNFSQIASGSIILPGLTIGKHCLIGAKSLINKNVPDFEFHAGNPAVRIGKVTHLWSNENKRPHYPWPYNFDRNLPWSGIGFDEWTKTEEGKMYSL
ncbi:MAG: hypothetical protein PHI70_07640 [Proteiniphilum sp.]|nr:hypothetical protein [Proteiniphilum sp.]MDD3909731.1 hypothetical protein [Proteiniphilum sp.]MDD4416639.1 hypothetical protein [Proteiniphilum sp.]